LNSLPYVHASWPSPLMSLQFNDHDFPPLQWHVFIIKFLIFKTILTGSVRKVVLRPIDLSLILPPI